MIPRRYINQWRNIAPWPMDSQVEQDLVICRTLIEIYNNEFLSKSLAFRGGTALGKLYLSPQPRYSEDIDLVQVHAGPIKPIIDELRTVLSFLEEPRIRQKANNNTLRFSYYSEIPPIIPSKLKVEINCREHFSVLGYKDQTFKIQNGWFAGNTVIKTYSLDEMMGTKLRALYQRKKGRDLFDLYKSLNTGLLNTEKVLKSYRKYMEFVVDHIPTKKEYLLNIGSKISDPEFKNDMAAILSILEKYDINTAYKIVVDKLIEEM